MSLSRCPSSCRNRALNNGRSIIKYFLKSCHSISLSFLRRGSDLDTNLEPSTEILPLPRVLRRSMKALCLLDFASFRSHNSCCDAWCDNSHFMSTLAWRLIVCVARKRARHAQTQNKINYKSPTFFSVKSREPDIPTLSGDRLLGLKSPTFEQKVRLFLA